VAPSCDGDTPIAKQYNYPTPPFNSLSGEVVKYTMNPIDLLEYQVNQKLALTQTFEVRNQRHWMYPGTFWTQKCM
jgi:hypothetical protein